MKNKCKKGLIEEGYYWVMFKGDDEWTIAEYSIIYDDYLWEVIGSDIPIADNEIETIGNKIDKPLKKKILKDR